MAIGIEQIMEKTASRTQENAVRQISLPASMVTVSRFPGSVMATTTVRIILMNWREFVVRLKLSQNLGKSTACSDSFSFLSFFCLLNLLQSKVTFNVWFICYDFSQFEV